MTEYQRELREWQLNNLEKSCRWDHVRNETFSKSWKEETFYDATNWWWDCNMLWNGYGLSSGIESFSLNKKGSLIWCKELNKVLQHSPVILILYYNCCDTENVSQSNAETSELSSIWRTACLSDERFHFDALWVKVTRILIYPELVWTSSNVALYLCCGCMKCNKSELV